MRSSSTDITEIKTDVICNSDSEEKLTEKECISKDLIDNCSEKIKKSKRFSKYNKGFIELRNDLKMEKITRKTQFDSLLKKAKAKIFRTIHETIRKCVNLEFKLLRLPQNFITNIKIEFNKLYLNKTIYQIYFENEIFESFDELISNKFIRKERLLIFKEFLNLTFKETFEYYITSKQFIRDKDSVRKKEGKKFSILFAYIAQNFFDYYSQSKGNKSKRIKIKSLNNS